VANTTPIVAIEMSKHDAEDTVSSSKTSVVFVVSLVFASTGLEFEAGGFAEHLVSAPLESSPAAFIVPAAHTVHALEATRSFAAHRIAV
jgi:hypothetical protein|tara:strand:+ start:211 stop:477 length:267 start_codon:yes stop_codon:yes gene_type:complete